MSYAAALDALAKAARARRGAGGVPEGRSRREVKRIVGGLEGDYVVATRRSSLLDPALLRRAGRGRAGGVPVPGHLRAAQGAAGGAGWWSSSWRRSSASSARWTCAYARRRKPDPLRRAHIASMVEREAQIPRERALIASVIYNRLRQGIPLGIDATVRFATNNWTRPLTQVAAGHRLALQHACAPGPAARADRQPGPGGDRGRGAPAPHRVPVLRGQARHVWGARLLGDRRRVPARRGPLQPRARAAWRASRRPTADGPRAARGGRLARGPQPLAGHAQRCPGRAGPGLALRAAAAARAPVRAGRSRLWAARASAGST